MVANHKGGEWSANGKKGDKFLSGCGSKGTLCAPLLVSRDQMRIIARCEIIFQFIFRIKIKSVLQEDEDTAEDHLTG